jgi:hypothetical protein
MLKKIPQLEMQKLICRKNERPVAYTLMRLSVGKPDSMK